MNPRSLLPFALASFTAVTIAIAGACAEGSSASPTVEAPTPEPTQTLPGPKDATSEAEPDSATDAATKTDAKLPDNSLEGQCKQEATFVACDVCCAPVPNNVGRQYYWQLVAACACVSDQCKAACSSTLCTGSSAVSPASDCAACLKTQSQACVDSAAEKCAINERCAPYLECRAIACDAKTQ